MPVFYSALYRFPYTGTVGDAMGSCIVGSMIRLYGGHSHYEKGLWNIHS